MCSQAFVGVSQGCITSIFLLLLHQENTHIQTNRHTDKQTKQQRDIHTTVLQLYFYFCCIKTIRAYRQTDTQTNSLTENKQNNQETYIYLYDMYISTSAASIYIRQTDTEKYTQLYYKNISTSRVSWKNTRHITCIHAVFLILCKSLNIRLFFYIMTKYGEKKNNMILFNIALNVGIQTFNDTFDDTLSN